MFHLFSCTVLNSVILGYLPRAGNIIICLPMGGVAILIFATVGENNRKSCNISSMSKSMMLINIMIVFIDSMKNDSFLVIRYHVVLLRSKLS